MNEDPQDVPADNHDAAPATKPIGKSGVPSSNSNKALWMGTAVGVGSAAIVAALLYSKRRKS